MKVKKKEYYTEIKGSDEKNPTEKELKELLKLAYQAGELGQKEKTRIDRMIEDGTKSFPKSPNFNDWYDTVILGKGVHINDQDVPRSKENEEFLRKLVHLGYYHR